MVNVITPDYRIREATSLDAEGVAFVHVNSWKTSYAGVIDQVFLENISYEKRLASWKEILRSKKTLQLVVLFGEQIVGFASAGPVRPELHASQHPFFKNTNESIGEIYAIYLLEQYKGKGCGKALFNACRNWLSLQGFESFVVRSLVDNVPARGFYESQGGEIIGEMTINIGDKDYQEAFYLFSVS